MKKEMYYVRTKRNQEGQVGYHRIGAVTVIKDDDGKYHRGISILSTEDNFDKREAVSKSYARADKAMGTKMSDLLIKTHETRVSKKGMDSVERFMASVFEMGAEFPVGELYKSGYDVKLSSFEERIFNGPKSLQ